MIYDDDDDRGGGAGRIHLTKIRRGGDPMLLFIGGSSIKIEITGENLNPNLSKPSILGNLR